MKDTFGFFLILLGSIVLALAVLFVLPLLYEGLTGNAEAFGWFIIISLFFVLPIGFFAGLAIFAGSMMKVSSSGRKRRRKHRASDDDGTLVLPDGTVVQKPEL